MGATSVESRNVASMFAGERRLVLRCYENLTAKIDSAEKLPRSCEHGYIVS